MAQISRNYTKFFYANLYKIPRYFEKFCDIVIPIFLTSGSSEGVGVEGCIVVPPPP